MPNLDSNNLSTSAAKAEISIETVPADFAGQRFDWTLAKMFPQYSRAKLQTWIKAGKVSVDGQALKARDKLKGGEIIRLEIIPEAVVQAVAQPIALPILYEDEAILILNKPVGLVVHPGAGNAHSTLMNGLLHYLPELEGVPRAGIVHRLDKDTAGLMVVAKTLTAHTHLVSELEQRNIKREYIAVCRGVPTAGGSIDQPIGRHPTQRKRMAVLERGGQTAKAAVTHYRVLQKFAHFTLLRCQLESGRTHQIRVHLTWRGYPLVGDQTYGGRLQIPRGASEVLQETLRQFKRQALHAVQLGFGHPVKQRFYQWQSPSPYDLQNLLDVFAQEDAIK